jgi:hypothetical protein
MKVIEKSYYCSGQFVFIPIGAILITVALVVLYFSWPLFNSIFASAWFLLLIAIGSVLISYRRKLTVSKLFLIEERSYFGLFPTIRKQLVGSFGKVTVTKHAYPPGQLYSDPESSADGCFVSFVPKQGNQNFDVGDFILVKGSNKKAIKGKIKFAKDLGKLTGLRVEYSQSVRAKISDDEIKML